MHIKLGRGSYPPGHLTLHTGRDHGHVIESRTSSTMPNPRLTRSALRPPAVSTGPAAMRWALGAMLALACLGQPAHAEEPGTPSAALPTVERSTSLPRLLLAAAPPTAAADSATDATAAPDASPARAQCLQECALASGQCSSEVRQARQECSRNTANAGRDPLSMRNDEYAYFCSYFANPGRCALGDCQRRFSGHLNVCLNVMQKNIAAMRHDCFRNERDAQRICRTELRACEAACPQ